jgi:predicted nucleic acid-binding Zn ribbon protein
MNQYQILEKILGTKKCPVCNKTLRVVNSEAICSKCNFSQELIYKDSKRDKKEKGFVQYRKLEDFIIEKE